MRNESVAEIKVKVNIKMKNKKEIIKFFNKNASIWDLKEKPQTYKKIKKIISKIKLKSYENVCDVACGTGILYPYLSKIFKKYIGIDISYKMIKIAKEKFPDGKFITGDFDTYRFKKNNFNLVIIFNSFPHFENKPKTILKAKRLLKKDGKLIIAHSFKLDKINKIHKKTKHHIIEKHLITEKELKELFKKSGFENIKTIHKDYFYIEGTK